MTATVPCPVCSSNHTAPALHNTDFLFRTTGKIFDFHRCRECEAGFLFPPPSASELSAAYPDRYWWTPGHSGGTISQRLEEWYRERALFHHVRIARRFLPPAPVRVLDAGCGNGTFLHRLVRATGCEAQGLEISAAAVKAARQTNGLSIHQGSITDGKFPAAHFQLITLFHVLEHLPRPQPALRRLAEWLAPGGTLLLQVPNLDSWQYRLFGRRWTGIDIPRHLTGFTPRTLQRVLQETGLTPFWVHHFSWRDSAAAITSSLAPGLDPVSLNLRQEKRLAFCKKLLYFMLLSICQPLALAEAGVSRGGVIFVAARHAPANEP